MPAREAGLKAVTSEEAAERDRWSLERAQRRHIERVLRACDGNKARAAEILGVRRTTLQRMLKKNPPTDH